MSSHPVYQYKDEMQQKSSNINSKMNQVGNIKEESIGIPRYSPSDLEYFESKKTGLQEIPIYSQANVQERLHAGFGMPGIGRLGQMQKEYGKIGQQRQNFLEEREKEAEKSYGRQIEAAEQGRLSAIQQAEQERSILEERTKYLDKFNIERERIEQLRMEKVNKETEKLANSMIEFQKEKINPNRIFRNADGSTNYVKTIGSAIAIGLGALGSSLPQRMGGGGPNYALQIIDKAISRDIDVQKSDLEKKRVGLGMQQNMLGMMRNQFADDRQAEAATRLNMLQSFEMELDNAAAMSKSSKLQAHYAQLKSGIEDKKNDLIAQFQDASYKDAKQTILQQYEMEKGRIGIGMQQAQIKNAMIAREAQAIKSTEEGIPPPGLRFYKTGFIPSKKSTEEAIAKMGDYDYMKKLFDRAIFLRKKYWGETFPGEAKAEMDSLSSEIKIAMKKFHDMGANFSESEQEMVDNLTGGNIASWDLFENIQTKLKTVNNRIDWAMDSYLKPRGFAVESAPIGISSAKKIE